MREFSQHVSKISVVHICLSLDASAAFLSAAAVLVVVWRPR
jgi:hypothetical protein